MTARTETRPAVLEAGPRAVLSGAASAWWQGLTDRPATTTVTGWTANHATDGYVAGCCPPPLTAHVPQ
ncbi:hypothetical protein [Gordonia aurantiaca]|uniref:hypothetical protein n=1 Tax=Gordonia sp. B21 TaxID=3151852 RepID=UPI003267DE53